MCEVDVEIGKMDDIDLCIMIATFVTLLGYVAIVDRRGVKRKRTRSCWAFEWLLDRDNPRKKTMIDLYQDLYEVCLKSKLFLYKVSMVIFT